MEFKPWLRQVIKTLKIDGILDSKGITEMVVSNYESVEELFEHGLGSQLVAQLLTEDLYDCENEVGNMEDFEGDKDNPGDNEDSDNEYDPDDDDDPEGDDEFPEEENIDNQTSEPDDDDDFHDDDHYPRYFNTRFVSAIIQKSEPPIVFIRVFDYIFLL